MYKQSKATVKATVQKLTNTIFKKLNELLNEVYKIKLSSILKVSFKNQIHLIHEYGLCSLEKL